MIKQQWFKRIVGDARNNAMQYAASVAERLGRRCLERKNTLSRLDNLECMGDIDNVFLLDSSASDVRIEILNSGVVRLDQIDCLDLDYGARGALRGWRGGRASIGHAAALWSHRWMGYYHWLIDVAPKIAAIQKKVGEQVHDLRWIYPRCGEAYESEVLEMLGIPDSHIIDSRTYRSIEVDSVAMVALPGWFEIQPAAALLRKRLLPFGRASVGDRIYLKRRGRRICVNEDEVVRFLSTRGFVMIEDVSRSVADQIGMFRNAKVVIAPHGAALANLLWCSGDCTVIECFAAGYCPPYYRNLAAFAGMTYASVGNTGQSHWTGVSSDIHIDITELGACMEKLGIS